MSKIIPIGCLVVIAVFAPLLCQQPAQPPIVTLWNGDKAHVTKPMMVCPIKGYHLEWTCYDAYCKGDAPDLTWLCVEDVK